MQLDDAKATFPENRRKIRVLQSFPEPRETTNPYIVMLRESLTIPEIDLETFSWKKALFSNYQVFHAHWPENLLTGSKKWLRRILFRYLLLRWRIRKVAIVRTQHNLDRPKGLADVDYRLLEQFENQTTLQIVLNDLTPTDKPSVLIKHGHYTNWYAKYPQPDSVTGRFGYFGLIRRYKNVAALVSTFTELPHKNMSLEIGGKPSSEELTAEITTAARDDNRIKLNLGFLTDEELVALARQAELVVLPYSEMHNSGSALAALSLGRPILVPANETNDQLADEVGRQWVVQYQPPLSTGQLLSALKQVRKIAPDTRPNLAEREWDKCGQDHLMAYQKAIALKLNQKIHVGG